MAGTPSNALNISGDGIVSSDLGSFSTSTVTQYGTLVAGPNQTVVSISPGTSGQVLVSNGAAANPSFQTVSASGITTIDGDTGSATGATVKFDGATQAGASVSFSATGSTVSLNTTDSNFNVLIGENTGAYPTVTGQHNTVIGYNSTLITSGQQNVVVGAQSLTSIGAGSANVAIGYGIGNFLGPTSSSSNNILIGTSTGSSLTAGSENSNILLNSVGVASDDNTLRIGAGTGTGARQLNKAFISGINGNTVSNTKMVTINSSTDQLGIANVPISGALILISTQTASSSSSIIFTGLNVYNVYFMTIVDCGPSVVNQSLEILVSQDNGSTYLSTGYSCGINYSAYNSSSLTNVNSTTYLPLTSGMFNSNTYSGHFYIFNTNVGSPFNIEGSGSWQDNSSGIVSGNYLGVGPTGVNAIKFQYASGNIAEGTFSLYGLSS